MVLTCCLPGKCTDLVEPAGSKQKNRPEESDRTRQERVDRQENGGEETQFLIGNKPPHMPSAIRL